MFPNRLAQYIDVCWEEIQLSFVIAHTAIRMLIVKVMKPIALIKEHPLYITCVYIKILKCFRKEKHDFRRAVLSGNRSYYTPGIYAEGYIVFVFPFVWSFVELHVLKSFMLRFLKSGISHQPHIRKHPYLGHRHLHSMTPDPRVHAPGWG